MIVAHFPVFPVAHLQSSPYYLSGFVPWDAVISIEMESWWWWKPETSALCSLLCSALHVHLFPPRFQAWSNLPPTSSRSFPSSRWKPGSRLRRSWACCASHGLPCTFSRRALGTPVCLACTASICWWTRALPRTPLSGTSSVTWIASTRWWSRTGTRRTCSAWPASPNASPCRDTRGRRSAVSWDLQARGWKAR